MAFTNTYTTGSLEVVKSVSEPGGTSWGTPRTFTLTVNCSYTDNSSTPVTSTVYTKTLTLSSPSNLSQRIDDIPTGSVCTVAETDAAGATTTAITGNTATIGNATLNTVTVTNTYSDATLTVSKAVHSSALDAGANPALVNYAFPISVDCTFQGAHIWGTGFTASPMTFTLQQGTSEAISGLPAGATCAVTETDAKGADSTSIAVANANASSSTTGTTASVTLTADNPTGTNTAAITNNYGVTSFSVTKVLAGGGAAQFAAASFAVHVTCTAPGIPVSYDGTITLPTAGGAPVRDHHRPRRELGLLGRRAGHARHDGGGHHDLCRLRRRHRRSRGSRDGGRPGQRDDHQLVPHGCDLGDQAGHGGGRRAVRRGHRPVSACDSVAAGRT
ncbi:MAG: DUF5979 domain-containing protein [Galbitalea sp.]